VFTEMFNTVYKWCWYTCHTSKNMYYLKSQNLHSRINTTQSFLQCNVCITTLYCFDPNHSSFCPSATLWSKAQNVILSYHRCIDVITCNQYPIISLLVKLGIFLYQWNQQYMKISRKTLNSNTCYLLHYFTEKWK